MTPKQADILDKQLDSLTKEQWRFFWRYVTQKYMRAIMPEWLKPDA